MKKGTYPAFTRPNLPLYPVPADNSRLKSSRAGRGARLVALGPGWPTDGGLSVLVGSAQNTPHIAPSTDPNSPPLVTQHAIAHQSDSAELLSRLLQT